MTHRAIYLKLILMMNNMFYFEKKKEKKTALASILLISRLSLLLVSYSHWVSFRFIILMFAVMLEKLSTKFLNSFMTVVPII